MIKREFKGSEGWITSYAFRFLGVKWIFAISETKWHKGEQYKRMPIWVSKIDNRVPALFIRNIAIGFDNKKGGTLINTEFAYKVLPDAKLAHDNEGNATAAFIKIVLNVTEEYATTEYNLAHVELIPFVAEKVMRDVCHIQPISLKEYEAEHKEE